MKRIRYWIIVVSMILGLIGCNANDYDFLGIELFELAGEIQANYVIRHAGQSVLYYNYERGDKVSTYNALIRQMKLKKTGKTADLSSGIYEITMDYWVFDRSSGQVSVSETQWLYLIINEDMVLYNDQWYEADTSRLLRQLERDFAG